MATAGFDVLIYRSGVSTSTTAEACSLVSGKTYRVTDAARRLLDPSQALTIDDNGSPVSAANIESVDHLHGLITFATAYTPTGPITYDGYYIPIAAVAEAHSFGATTSRTMLDDTKIGATAHTRIAGLKDISGTLELYDEGADAIGTLAANGTIAYLVIAPGGSTAEEHLRARVLFESLDVGADSDSLVSSSYAFVGASTKDQEGRPVPSWSFAY